MLYLLYVVYLCQNTNTGAESAGGAWGGFHDAGHSPLKPNVQYELQLQRQSGEIKARL